MSRILACICLFAVCLAAGPSRGDVKDDLQGIKREIKEKKLLLKRTAKVETKVSDELLLIEKRLKEKEAALASLGRDLRTVESALERAGARIDRAKNEAEAKKKQIARRLSALYKAGEFTNARMFFSAESFPQMVESLRYTQSILSNDRRLVSEYNGEIARLQELKASLEQDLTRKEKIKSSIEVKTREVVTEQQKKAAYLHQVRDDKSHYLASLKSLEANARRLQSMVERLEAKSRKSYTQKLGKKGIAAELGKGLPLLPDKGFGAQKGRLALPTKGEITARFGKHKHPEFNSFTISNGISIAAPAGSDIRSVFDGQVIFADYFKGYGNMVIVDHGSGFFSLYAHAAKMTKKVGSSVARNDVVASVGESDSSTGAQLYFEIRYQGKPVDPSPWFR